MKTLHICNINFEWELKTHSQLSIKESFMVFPNFLQLQFLPFIYAKKGDGVVVTHLPPEIPEGIKLHHFDEKIEGYDRLETWGWSKAIERWTSMPYDVPSYLKDVASKAFAFTHSPNLPGAKLFHRAKEVEEWVANSPFPQVIKTCFGCSGREKFILHSLEDYQAIQKDVLATFEEGHLLIGEPWVNRTMDFSTQWYLDDEITYLGSTVMRINKWGTYSRTYLGKSIPFLQEHLDIAMVPLRHLLERGFRGNVGIDAMIYDENKLHPIVEINTRKTMGWLALTLGKSLSFETGTEGLLPSYLMTPKKIPFQKQLNLLQ